ncbi:MAG: hypothetical protein EOO83_04070 [Oxalobacteraceae bacterium]|nr:MAG: hypothetical protein EOO83_04070 [Oxalobacteraceae bacterium]
MAISACYFARKSSGVVMQGKKSSVGKAAIIVGALAGIIASLISWEELPAPAGEFAFWATKIFAGLGGVYLLGLLIWSWKSNREMNRLIDQRARFQSRMTPENQTYFNALSDDPSEHKHSR